MQRPRMALLFLALALFSQVEARHLGHAQPATKIEASKPVPAAANVQAKQATASSSAKAVPAAAKPVEAKTKPVAKAEAAAPAKKTALVHFEPKVSPPIHTGTDKEFFGPPFPANYPDDKRPVVEKSILDRLKGPDQPYPALQSRADYDSDYVKDENSDHGDWKAQFDYDSLRKRLAKEKSDSRNAGATAGKEGQDVDDAQSNVDKAQKDMDDARKGVDDAKAGEDIAKHDPDDWAGPPSHEKLEKLKAAVADAEKNYAKEQKEFEECKRQLEEAKKILDDLKAREAEMEKEHAAQTKLWMDTKTVRLNAKKAKEDAAHTKTIAARLRVKAAEDEKARFDEILAAKKAKHEVALKSLAKEKADVEHARQKLEKATLRLQKIRGVAPPTKSSASMVSVLLSFAMLASCLF